MHTDGPLAVTKGTCSHRGLLWDGHVHSWGPAGGQDELSPALMWTAQSQEARAKEGLPGQAAAAAGPAERAALG